MPTSKPTIKHGHCKRGVPRTATYKAWCDMKSRCLNPNRQDFHYYGGRDIKVCDRWLSFENFLADMGERPDGLTLERLNNNGNYEPSNCRWATWSEQNQNKRQRKQPLRIGLEIRFHGLDSNEHAYITRIDEGRAYYSVYQEIAVGEGSIFIDSIMATKS